MAEVELLLSVAHFPESPGMSYNAQLVTPALRGRETERGAGTTLNTLRDHFTCYCLLEAFP